MEAVTLINENNQTIVCIGIKEDNKKKNCGYKFILRGTRIELLMQEKKVS